MMEHKNNATNPAQEIQQEVYTPRPAWQVWAARIGLVLFIGLVILSYILLANGALL